MKFTQERETVEKVLEKLRSKHERLEESISEREDYCADKSDKWNDSAAGEAYYEKTEQLEETAGQLQEVIDNLEEALNTLEEL